MLNYLAVALPADAGAAARLIALQCALRVNESAQVRLPVGVLRSLRLATAADSWRELSQARWLRTLPTKPDSGKRVVAIQMLDAGLLGQHPARPDRLMAADWALRISCHARVGSAPRPRLASLFLVAHATQGEHQGTAEVDQMARECGSPIAALTVLLDRLVTATVLTSWETTPVTGDLCWILGTITP